MINKQELENADIDYNSGIVRFVGKEELYEKYLRKFLENDSIRLANDEYINQNYNGVLEVIHTLKGNSGTLGMTNLYTNCSTLVDGIRAGRTDEIEFMLYKVETEFNICIEAVKKSLNII